eukprot:763219-Hanusia_phi.AAC.1
MTTVQIRVGMAIPRIVFCSARDILAGEELTISYGEGASLLQAADGDFNGKPRPRPPEPAADASAVLGHAVESFQGMKVSTINGGGRKWEARAWDWSKFTTITQPHTAPDSSRCSKHATCPLRNLMSFVEFYMKSHVPFCLVQSCKTSDVLVLTSLVTTKIAMRVSRTVNLSFGLIFHLRVLGSSFKNDLTKR